MAHAQGIVDVVGNEDAGKSVLIFNGQIQCPCHGIQAEE